MHLRLTSTFAFAVFLLASSPSAQGGSVQVGYCTSVKNIGAAKNGA